MKGILTAWESSQVHIGVFCISVTVPGMLYMSTNKLINRFVVVLCVCMCVFPGGVWLHSSADALAAYQDH